MMGVAWDSPTPTLGSCQGRPGALSVLMNGELVGCLGVVGVQVRFQKAPIAWDGLEEGLQRRGDGGCLPLRVRV